MIPRPLLLCLACQTLLACGPPARPVIKPRPQIGLHIICEPADAQLYVDDRYMGSTEGLAKRALELSPGVHRIEIRRVGHFAHFAEVTLARGVKQVLKVKMRREPF